MKRALILLLLALPMWAQRSSTASHITMGPTLPAKCSPLSGDVFFKTAATIGVYQCTATDTWSAISGGSTPASEKVRTCEIVVGDPGAGSTALANDNDSPAVCGNKSGAAMTITAVECRADAGSPTVTPIITGGAANSILTGALTCGTGSFATGTLNGSPSQADGASIDGNITVAGGTAKYIIIRITRTL